MPDLDVRRKDIRQKAGRRKLKNKSRVYHRKINKRKHYGLGVEIEEYEEAMKNSIDKEAIDDVLSRYKESTLTESVVEDIVAQIGLSLIMDDQAVTAAGNVIMRSYEKGSNRVFDTKGEKLETPDVSKRPAEEMSQEQLDYFENMAEDTRDQVRDDLKNGIEEGKSIPDMRDEIMDDVDNITSNRAETIARSEVIKASSKGTEQAMDEAGIENVIWLATEDDRTCEQCEGFHETRWERDNPDRPMPVEDTHPNSYDEKTEVLTESGWKLVKDIEEGEKCWSMNPRTHKLELVEVTETFEHKEDEMLHFFNRSFDMKVTKDHNMFYQPKPYKEWGFLKAHTLQDRYSGKIARTGKWQGENKESLMLGNKEIDINLYAEFMGWYLSEGSVTEGRVHIAQDQEKNSKNYKVIEELLMEIGFDFYGCENYFEIKDEKLANQLKDYGKCNEKYIPEEIKQSTKEVIRIFLDTYLKGDGYQRENSFKGKKGNFKDEKEYFTSSKQMADDIGELILKVGNRPSYKLQGNKGREVEHRNGKYTGNFDIWRIRECYCDNASLYRMNVEVKPYSKKAYCLQLPKYHTLYVRRNGKCAWSGNCRCTIVADVE